MLVLIGGGWDLAAVGLVYGPFVAEAASQAGRAPTIACVVIDEGDGAEFERWRAALVTAGDCRPRPILVPLGSPFDPASLGDADALLICGGLTPAYADSLVPSADAIREWLGERPFAGFSAGAAIASTRALVGGYLLDGRPVCPDETAEDLDEVTVVAGLGLIQQAIDVHASQWGTLGRLVAAVGSGLLTSGIALDDDTALVATAGQTRVVGLGAAYLVTSHSDDVAIRTVPAGSVLPIAL